MNQVLSEAGKLSAKLRQTPELAAAKAESVRLYCDLKFGIIDISILINRNRGEIRRWLIAAGVYVSSRSNKTPTSPERRESEAKCWRDDRKIKAQIFALVHQCRAWRREWIGAEDFDENNHWGRHPDRIRYIANNFYSPRAYKKWRLQNPKREKSLKIGTRLREAWRQEWKDVRWWDECKHWERHPIRKRVLAAAAVKIRRATDVEFKVADAIRCRMRIAIRRSLAGKYKNSETLCGCSWAFLIKHLESKFKPGMSWANYGPYWHIDHKMPCASFDLTKESEQRKCFHWTNLQPLTAVENFRKSDRLELVRAHDLSARLSSSS